MDNSTPHPSTRARGEAANGDGPPITGLLAQLEALRDESTALLAPSGAGPSALDAAALRAMTLPPRAAHVGGLVERASLVLTLGAKGIGKTALILDWLYRQSLGLDWLGFPTLPAGAQVFEAELQPEHLQQRQALLEQDLIATIRLDLLSRKRVRRTCLKGADFVGGAGEWTPVVYHRPIASLPVRDRASRCRRLDAYGAHREGAPQ